MFVWLTASAADRLRPNDEHRRDRSWFVVQADWISKNPKALNLLIAPFSTLKPGQKPDHTSTQVYATHPIVRKEGFIICSEIQCVATSDIRDYEWHGPLDDKFVKALDYRLKAVLGIRP